MPTKKKPDHHPHPPPPPPKQMGPVSPLAIKEQERVKETSLVSGRFTAVVAGGGRVAEQAGPGGTADCGEWSPSWRGWWACWRGGPPYPG